MTMTKAMSRKLRFKEMMSDIEAVRTKKCQHLLSRCGFAFEVRGRYCMHSRGM
jgi:hypothetical protein